MLRSESVLDTVPIWLVFVLTIVLVLLAIQLGVFLGTWRSRRAGREGEGPLSAIVGSVLGLLAFMMAFTFSLAASRFDTRKQLVLDEANALGTTHLRAGLLPEAERSSARALIREYVGLRLEATNPDRLDEALAGSERIQTVLWQQAEALGRQSPGSETYVLYIESLNEVIDLHAARVTAALRNRIPAQVWWILYAITAVAMVTVGYQAGVGKTRRPIAAVALATVFSLVLILVTDLDRTQEGMLRVSQQALFDLQTKIGPPGGP